MGSTAKAGLASARAGRPLAIRRRISLLALAICALALLALAPAAQADLTFGPQGSAAGQTDNPQGLAVDGGSGELFVADTGNKRVDVFDAAGNFIRAFGWGVDTGAAAPQVCTGASGCQAGLFGAGGGQFGSSAEASRGPAAIAVDSAGHDVYVYDHRNARIERFKADGEFVLTFGDGVDKTSAGDVCTAASGDVCGAGEEGFGSGQLNNNVEVAVGAGGVIYVADNATGESADARVQAFEPSGALIGQTLLRPKSGFFAALATDAAGNFYLPQGTVRKFDSSGAEVTPKMLNPSSNIQGLSVDRSSGRIFVSDSAGLSTGSSFTGVLNVYDAAGAQIAAAYGETARKMTALAARHTGSGDVYAIHEAGPATEIVQVPLPKGPVVVPTPPEASPVGNLTATLHAFANPEGKESTVHFEYVDDASFQSEGGFAGPHTVKTPESAPLGADFKPHAASFAVSCPEPEKELGEGKCLKAETLYHFRAVVSDGADPPETGPEAEFETLPPLQLGPAWSTAVGTESARLNAELNPTAIAAGAWFEYVDDASFQSEGGFAGPHTVKTPEIDFGAGSSMLSRSALAYPLAPDTTYHYRYTAKDFFGSFSGPEAEGTLSTLPANSEAKECPANQQFRNGASANLPDCRAYEMVSPLEKGNGDVVALLEATLDVFGETKAHLNQAAAGGDALTYSSQRSFGDAISAPYTSQYIARRGAGGWSSHAINAPREGLSLYEIPAVADSLFKGFSEDLCSGWMVQDVDVALAPGAPAGVPNLYRRQNCGEEGDELLTSAPPPGFGKEAEPAVSGYFPTVQGFSADGGATAFKAPAALTPQARTVPVGETLTCQPIVDGITEVEEEGKKEKVEEFTYRWLRDGAEIGGAGGSVDLGLIPPDTKAAKYTTKAEDAGKAIQCQVFSSKFAGATELAGATQVSNPAQIVAPFPATAPPIAPAQIAAPTASAALAVGSSGQTLSCDPQEAKWEGGPSFTYRWYRNGVSIGTGPTHLVSPAELASAAVFQCAVSGENAGGEVSEASADLLSDPAPKEAPQPQPRVLDLYRAYLHDEGGLHLVSVLPGGEAAQTHASVGTAQKKAGNRFFDSVAGAVSADGGRVFWSAEDREPAPPAHLSGAGADAGLGPSRLYLRLNAAREQSALAHVSGTGKLQEGSKTVSSFLAAKGQATLTAGSSALSAVETSAGQFVVGQTIAGKGIPAATTILAVGKSTLTLSAAVEAGKSATNVTISSKGPAPFAVGQPIAGPGIPGGTTITTTAEGSLTLSKAAGETTNASATLTATTGCTEAAKACTIQLSEGPGVFRAADPAASRAIFSEGEDLFEADVAKAAAHEAGAKTLIAHKVEGLLGTSEDARRVYLVSEEACGGAGLGGKLNLYLYEAGESCGGGEFTFVARLQRGLNPGESDALSFAEWPVDRSARVSANGLEAVFMSRAKLTGYDNADAGNGKADSEVYLYDAAEEELRCASCNPSGARPEGRDIKTNSPYQFWTAARIPGWETQWHASRVLSADASRLFFESFEGLVSRDTNGKQDVYEWERVKGSGATGKKECLQDIGGELFAPQSGGCLSLISSGKSAADAEFLDASGSGKDVFFTTASSLVPQDPGLVDVYDAREGGGFPVPPPPNAACEGEACQSPPEGPNDPTPASSAFEGAGNVPAEPARATPPCATGKVRRKGRCVAKHHQRKRAHHKRAHRRHRAKHNRRTNR